MADMRFKILRGKKENLFLDTTPKKAGYWYVTDTAELYTCLVDGEDPVKVNDVEPFDPSEINKRLGQLEADVAGLQSQVASGNVVTVESASDLLSLSGNESTIYIVKEDNTTRRWAGGNNYTISGDPDDLYTIIGRDYEEISCINGGTAESV